MLKFVITLSLLLFLQVSKAGYCDRKSILYSFETDTANNQYSTFTKLGQEDFGSDATLPWNEMAFSFWHKFTGNFKFATIHIFAGIGYNAVDDSFDADNARLVIGIDVNKKLAFGIKDYGSNDVRMESTDWKLEKDVQYHFAFNLKRVDSNTGVLGVRMYNMDADEVKMTDFTYDPQSEIMDQFTEDTTMWLGFNSCAGGIASYCYIEQKSGIFMVYPEYNFDGPELEYWYFEHFADKETNGFGFIFDSDSEKIYSTTNNSHYFVMSGTQYHEDPYLNAVSSRFYPDQSLASYYIGDLKHNGSVTVTFQLQMRLNLDEVAPGSILSLINTKGQVNFGLKIVDEDTLSLFTHNSEQEFAIDTLFPNEDYQNIIIALESQYFMNEGLSYALVFVNGTEKFQGFMAQRQEVQEIEEGEFYLKIGKALDTGFSGYIDNFMYIPLFTINVDPYMCHTSRSCEITFFEGFCNLCKDGYLSNLDTKDCEAFDTKNVGECLPTMNYIDNDQSCTCQQQYRWVQADLGCEKCKTNGCRTCEDDADICTSCMDNLFFDEAKNKCLNCPENCRVCSDEDTCVECDDGTFMNQDGVCVSSCDVNYYSNSTDKTCNKCNDTCVTCNTANDLYCPQDIYDDARETASAASTMSSASNGMAAASVANSAAGPSAFGIVILTKFLLYIRYMDVQFSPQLHLFLKNYDDSTFSFGVPIPSAISEAITKQKIPDNFEKYGMHSSFIINYWGTFSTLLIVLGISLFFTLLVFIAKRAKSQRWTNVAHRFQIILGWNLLFLILLGGYDEIALYSSLELRTLNINSFWESFGLIICLAMLLLAFLVIFWNGWLVYKYQKIRKQKGISRKEKREKLSQFVEKEEKFQVLFKGYKEDCFTRQAYMFFFISRAAAYNFIVAYLFEHPMIQSASMSLMSFVIFIYLLSENPFTSWIGLLEICLYEICVFVTNILVFAMAIFDSREQEATSQRETFGVIIIWAFFIFSVIALAFLIINLLMGIIAIIKAIKNYKKGQKIGCLELITIPFQPGAIDLDQLQFGSQSKKPSKAAMNTAKVTPMELTPQNPFSEREQMNAKEGEAHSRAGDDNSPADEARSRSGDDHSPVDEAHLRIGDDHSRIDVSKQEDSKQFLKQKKMDEIELKDDNATASPSQIKSDGSPKQPFTTFDETCKQLYK